MPNNTYNLITYT